MSYVIPEGLPSLACPLIISPALSFGKNKGPLYQPPFPWIDLNSEGFTLPHLHIVGVNVSEPWQRSRLIKLARLHEWCHESLIRTPFLQLITWHIVKLYTLIVNIVTEGREPIEVPLSHELSRNELEKHWRLAVGLKRASRLVEEVYAVRTSLLKAKELDYIENELAQEILTHYKTQYDNLMYSISGVHGSFRVVYEMFPTFKGLG
jgi:hypothetical protein